MTEDEKRGIERKFIASALSQGMPDQVAAADYARHVLDDPYRYRTVGVSEKEYDEHIEKLRTSK